MAERAVVGEAIFNPSTVREVVAVVAPGDFADVRLGQVLGLVAGMVSAGGPESVTPLTVAAEIARRRAAQRAVTGPRGVSWVDPGEVASLVTHGVHGSAARHAGLVRSAAVARAIAAFGRRATHAAETGAVDPAVLAAEVVEEARSIRDGWRSSSLTARTLGDVLDEDDGAYDWLVPGLMERRDRLIVTGGEGLGKTTALRQIAVCAAAGVHPFSTRPAPPATVLVVDCENSERQWRRASRGLAAAASRLGGSGDPREGVRLACVGRMDVTSAADLGALHGLLDEHSPDLVVIGPLYRLLPRAITTDDDAAPVLAALDSIRDRGPGLVVEAHAGHAIGRGGERDFRPRGSSALLGWPEFGLGLAPDVNDPGLVHVIRWRGDRDERDWPPRLRRGGDLPWTDDRKPPEREDHRLRAVKD